MKWLSRIYNFRINDKDIALGQAKKKARMYWDKYGEKTIKKAINNKDCTNSWKFENLCNEITEQNKNKKKKVLNDRGWYEVTNNG